MGYVGHVGDAFVRPPRMRLEMGQRNGRGESRSGPPRPSRKVEKSDLDASLDGLVEHKEQKSKAAMPDKTGDPVE